jgi:hypothetical protein
MLWTISSILLSLWLLAIATPSFLHGYVHILLVVAVIGMTVRFWPKKKDPIDGSRRILSLAAKRPAFLFEIIETTHLFSAIRVRRSYLPSRSEQAIDRRKTGESDFRRRH